MNNPYSSFLKDTLPVRRIAFLGNYIPRQCGIATFTYDLRTHFQERYTDLDTFVVAVEDHPGEYNYPSEVRYAFDQNNRHAYADAAKYLNESKAEMICLQHEYGIYGGDSGEYLLDLLKRLHMPVVTTLHTILEHPSPSQERVLKAIGEASAYLVVMSERGKMFLETIYDIAPEKIAVIPHGIPDVPFTDPGVHKEAFGLKDKKVVLTFGLISPNKGIETAISALPEVVKKHPDLTYIILGATHPNLIREHGEVYRESLIRLAEELGVSDHVQFHNRFVEKQDLIEYLEMADVYLTPYLNPAQITSGTLAYSVGCGKAVISTPYWHAEELLADDRGILVPFSSSEAIADALIHIFDEPAYFETLREKAYTYSRPMVWHEVAGSYHDFFGKSVAARQHKKVDKLPTLKLDHVYRLTDYTGIIQHARYTLPHREEGYCTDDNARALLLAAWMDSEGEIVDARIPWMIDVYSSFLNHAFEPAVGRFRNFMSYGREWLETFGSDDSHGRAIWALGGLVAHTRRDDLRSWALDLFNRSLEKVTEMNSPRCWAFTMLGLTEFLNRYPGELPKKVLRQELGDRLCALHKLAARPHWFWFEPILSYDNARLSQALLLSDVPEHKELGLKTLEWLRDVQTAEDGHFRPIGSDGFYPMDSTPAVFDQQPIEAAASVSAYLSAYNYTKMQVWKEDAQSAFAWFMGKNDTGLSLYDETSGGCYDGLQPHSVNSNQGAESCLAYLMARTEIRAIMGKNPTEETVKKWSKDLAKMSK